MPPPNPPQAPDVNKPRHIRCQLLLHYTRTMFYGSIFLKLTSLLNVLVRKINFISESFCFGKKWQKLQGRTV